MFRNTHYSIFLVLRSEHPNINLLAGVHGDCAEKSKKTEFYARAQIKKLSKELEALKKENEEYAKQAKYFVNGINDHNHPHNGNNLVACYVK